LQKKDGGGPYFRILGNVFYILNQGRISKIEKKYLMGQTLPKKGHFLGESRALDEKDFGYVSGRHVKDFSCSIQKRVNTLFTKHFHNVDRNIFLRLYLLHEPLQMHF